MCTTKQADKSYIAVMGKIFGVLECFVEKGTTQGLAFSEIAKGPALFSHNHPSHSLLAREVGLRGKETMSVPAIG